MQDETRKIPITSRHKIPIAALAMGGLFIAVAVLAHTLSSPAPMHEVGIGAGDINDLVAAPVQSETDGQPADPFANWQRPEGPVRIALQAGHWKRTEAPDEQVNLRYNNAEGNGYSEWEVNLAIAEETRALLLAAHPDYIVDILPTTVPPDTFADVFVSIHADANPSRATRGYKVASPRRDRTGDADRLAAVVSREYAAATSLPHDTVLTSAMRGYYAFNWCKYEHSLHPMTAAVIVETGFLTNAQDIAIIGRDPALAARGITNGILAYLDGDEATKEEIATVTTVPEWVREGERERAAEQRAYEQAHDIVNPSSLIPANANRPDDPWCQTRY